MKRFLACLVALVVVVGGVPAPAFALAREGTASGLAAGAVSGALRAEGGAVGATGVSATFTDAKLYDALVAELQGQAVGFTCNATDKTIALTAAEAAKVTTLDLSYSSISKAQPQAQARA